MPSPPDQLWESRTTKRVGSPTSGLDTCALGSVCWDVDPMTGEGTRVAMCPDDGEHTCNPLVQDCERGEGCYPIEQWFSCASDDSGDTGQAGDPCDFINSCAPGNFCTASAAVPDCLGPTGCCSSLCTLGDDSSCLPGQICEPWSDAEIGNWQWSPLWDVLGACVLPS